MSKASGGLRWKLHSAVDNPKVNSAALLQMLWVRVVLYVYSSFSVSDVPASDAALFIMSCDSS